MQGLHAELKKIQVTTKQHHVKLQETSVKRVLKS
jgi:hypothetical protein